MKIKNITLSLLALGFISFYACEKIEVTNKTVTPIQQVMDNPSGFGTNAGKPYCAPYFFPASIQLIGEMQSTAYKTTFIDKEKQNAEDFIIYPKTNYIPVGSGSYVQVYIKLFNSSAVKQTLIIPGGLIVTPEDTTCQTGVIVQTDTIVINPNDTTGVLLKAYCTNLHKHVPSNTKFKIAGTTLHNDMYRMVAILKNKQKLQQNSQVQSIVWNITDHGGLTDADLTYLNSLP